MAKKKIRHDVKVWGYPATDDNDGPIDWAWACRCGKHGHGYPTSQAAEDGQAGHRPAE